MLSTHHGYHPIGSLIDYLEKEPIDHVLCLAQHAHIHFFLEAGCQHIASLPRSGPPSNIKPTSAKKEFPVTYVGRKWSHAHPYRNWMVQHLERTLPQFGIPFYIHTYCSHQEWLDVVSRSLITVCSSLNGQFTPQVFNIMHAGSLCLTDELSPQTGMYEFFEPDRHFVTWRDYNDLVEKIRYYVGHPAEAEKIAQAGQQRAEECFPANRLEGRAIFDFAVSDKLPPEFRPEIDRRCRVIRSKNKSEFKRRVCLYENMQELHRVHKRLRVISWQLHDNAPVADLVDLPRLELSCTFSSPESYNEWRDVFEQASILKQVELLTVDDNVKPDSFDIGIVDAATLDGGNVAQLIHCLNPRALLWVLGDINNDGHKKLKQSGFRQFDFNSVEMRLQRTIIPRFRYYLPHLVFPAPLSPATELVAGLQAYQRGRYWL